MAKRPLVESAIRTEFGDVLEDAAFYDASSVDRDLSYVPGFSEMRRAHDLVLAEIAQGKRDKKDRPDALPVNCRWVRTHSPASQQPDAQKQIGSGNLGYKVVNKTQVGEPWLREIPPGSTVGADGSIRKGDTVLMVTDGKNAARNAARKTIAANQQLLAAQNTADGLLKTRGKFAGVDPYIKVEDAVSEK